MIGALHSLIGRFIAAREGSSAAEFALVAPVFILLLFGTIEAGRIMWTQNALQSAVEATARCSALARPGCATVGDAQAYAVASAMGVGIDPSAFSISTDASCGRMVEATYAFNSIIPLVPLEVDLEAKACRAIPS